MLAAGRGERDNLKKSHFPDTFRFSVRFHALLSVSAISHRLRLSLQIAYYKHFIGVSPS